MNPHMPEGGISDSREEAIAYISRLAMGHEHDPTLIEVFVDYADMQPDQAAARLKELRRDGRYQRDVY